MCDSIQNVLAIDVHAHYGLYGRGEPTTLLNRFMSADAATVSTRASVANIEWTVVSPLMSLYPKDGMDVTTGNDEAALVVEQTSGLLQWVVVNPLQPSTFEQAREKLTAPKCVGIKVHPEEHGYNIAEHGGTIFEIAAQLGATVMAHSGNSNSLPLDFIPFANAFSDVDLILAHLGNADDGSTFDLQVQAIQASKHGNVFSDTSSARSLYSGLIEWAVGEVGAEHLLFGTDSPLYSTSAQRARIEHAELTEPQKRMILRDNAEQLLSLKPQNLKGRLHDLNLRQLHRPLGRSSGCLERERQV